MGKKALVLVDGGRQQGDGLDKSLLGEGYVVDTPSDSWQAIRNMKEIRYDLAIIDLDLPPVHGVAVTAWDLGRIFRAYNPAVSIVYLSRSNSKERKDFMQEWRHEADRLQGKGACPP